MKETCSFCRSLSLSKESESINEIKKIMKWSVITMAMMAGICFAPQSGKAAEKLEVKIPTERAIYQRDNNNYANVKVSIEYSGTGEVSAKLYDGDKELGKNGGFNQRGR